MKATKAVPCFRCSYVIQPGQEIVQRAYGTYHEKCYRELCTAGPRIPGIGVTAILALLFCLPAFAERPAPQMTCVSTTRTVAFCFVDGATGTIPSWRVFDPETGEVFQESDGFRTWVQANEKPRIVEAIISIGESDFIKRCWVVLSGGKTKLSDYRNSYEVVTQAARPP